MKKKDQNRNFTISSKVSSIQKAKYIQEAKNLNLSLSEWMCGTLDMSLNAYKHVNQMEKLEQLYDEINDKTNIIKNLELQLKKANARLKLKKQIIASLCDSNSENSSELYVILQMKLVRIIPTIINQSAI